jgi:hypothetical protein
MRVTFGGYCLGLATVSYCAATLGDEKDYSCLLAFVVVTLAAGTAQADEVTDWNQTMLRAALVGATSPPVTSRVAAIVQAAVFDAVNGIARQFWSSLVNILKAYV